MSDIKTGSVTIKSLLDVDFASFPTAIQRDGTIKFTASSLNAKFYEWNFGDGIKDYGSNKSIQHTYEKS
jgi:PKD repeat protein